MKINQIHLAVICFLPLIVVACGGNDNGNSAWVEITQPSVSEYYEALEARPLHSFGGNAFNNASISSHCTGFPFPVNCVPSSINNTEVLVINETNNSRRSLILSQWIQGTVLPVNLGNNSIVVIANDSSGNHATDRITVYVPPPRPIYSLNPAPNQIFPKQDTQADISTPTIAANSNGDAILAWIEDFRVYASIYNEANGWSHPGLIIDSQDLDRSIDGDYLFAPEVLINSSGSALVVWYAGGNIKSSYYDAANLIWSRPEIIASPEYSNSTTGGYNTLGEVGFKLVPGNDDSVLFFWSEPGPWAWFNYLAISRFNFLTGWDVEHKSGGSFYRTREQIISDNDGGAIRASRWGSTRFSWDGGWDRDSTRPFGECQLFNASRTSTYTNMQIVLSESGSMAVTWTCSMLQPNLTRSSHREFHEHRANYYHPGSGWGEEVILGSITRDKLPNPIKQYTEFSSDAAIDSTGNAIFTWIGKMEDNDQVYVREYNVGSGWGTSYSLAGTHSISAKEPKVTIQNSGKVIIVWLAHDEWTYSIAGIKKDAVNGWGNPELVEANTAPGSSDLSLVKSIGDSVFVSWGQYTETWVFDEAGEYFWEPREEIDKWIAESKNVSVAASLY